jgi:hypothetical protein
LMVSVDAPTTFPSICASNHLLTNGLTDNEEYHKTKM